MVDSHATPMVPPNEPLLHRLLLLCAVAKTFPCCLSRAEAQAHEHTVYRDGVVPVRWYLLAVLRPERLQRNAAAYSTAKTLSQAHTKVATVH